MQHFSDLFHMEPFILRDITWEVIQGTHFEKHCSSTTLPLYSWETEAQKRQEGVQGSQRYWHSQDWNSNFFYSNTQ